MEELKTKLKNNLRDLTFNEIIEILNKTELIEAREIILDVLSEKYPIEFEKWIDQY